MLVTRPVQMKPVKIVLIQYPRPPTALFPITQLFFKETFHTNGFIYKRNASLSLVVFFLSFSFSLISYLLWSQVISPFQMIQTIYLQRVVPRWRSEPRTVSLLKKSITSKFFAERQNQRNKWMFIFLKSALIDEWCLK